jgi:hypothetical protein
MRLLLATSSLLALASFVACNGEIATHPGDSQSAVPPTPDAGSSATPDPALAACSRQTASSPTSFASAVDLQSRLGKVWRACPGATHAVGAFGGTAGFEVLPDGHYYALGLDASGNLYRMTGFANEAQLTYVPEQGSTQDLVYPGGGLNGFLFEFSPDGNVVTTEGEAGGSGPYVATSAPVNVLAKEPEGAREGQAGCATMETDLQGQPASVPAANASVVGRWITCPDTSGSPVPGSAMPGGAPDPQGIEFDADGTWALLVGANAASAERSTDPNVRGTYSSFSSGPGQWQLNAQVAAPNGGTFIFNFALSGSPVKLQLLNEGGVTVLSAQ